MQNPIARTYLSLGAFYASDPARRNSRERDVGLFWRSRQGPTYRAAWVRDTGELYLFQHALGARGGGSVHLLEPALELGLVHGRREQMHAAAAAAAERVLEEVQLTRIAHPGGAVGRPVARAPEQADVALA